MQTFESHLVFLREKSFILTGLTEWTSKSPPFRCWLNNSRHQSYIHGIGWGESPLEALLASEVAFWKEVEHFSRPISPKASLKVTLTFEDLNL